MSKGLVAVLVILMTIAGYIYCRFHHRLRFTLERSSGYHTFLMCVTAGFAMVVVACLVHIFFSLVGVEIPVGKWVVEHAIFGEKPSANTRLAAELIGGAFVAAFFLSNFRRFFAIISGNDRALILGEFVSDDENPEFTILLVRSVETLVPILFTMSDRKVFIGYPYIIPAGEFNDIQILPLFSGYRDKDTLSLRLTTPYKDVLAELNNNSEELIDEDFDEEFADYFEEDDGYVDESMFLITLPVREIVHAHLHSMEYFEHFKRHERQYGTEKGYGTEIRPNVTYRWPVTGEFAGGMQKGWSDKIKSDGK